MSLRRKGTQLPPVEYNERAYDAFDVGEVPIGVTDGGPATGMEWVTVPLSELAPHGVMSAAAGWCKTTTAKVFVAHVAGHGARVFINDPKRAGYDTAFGGIPTIQIRTGPQEWAAGWDEFVDELENRYRLIEKHPQIVHDLEMYFQPWFMVTDERGAYNVRVKQWSRSNGHRGMPAPFASEQIALWQGRAVGMHLFDLCLQADRGLFTDSENWGQRSWRIASGPQTFASKMTLFPFERDVATTAAKGQALLSIGAEPVAPIQLIAITDDDARAYAWRGAVLAKEENARRALRLDALENGQSA